MELHSLAHQEIIICALISSAAPFDNRDFLSGVLLYKPRAGETRAMQGLSQYGVAATGL
jgi:hypothetical protein